MFQAELSKHLLEQMPQLELLLVDPYHLRLEGEPLMAQERLKKLSTWLLHRHLKPFSYIIQRFGGLSSQFHLPGAAEEQPQGLQRCLGPCHSATQPHRSRATHVVQMSGPAAEWVARSHGISACVGRILGSQGGWKTGTVCRGSQGLLDGVYVDGDHSYEGAAKDISAWWPTVKPGGFMAGHAAGPFSRWQTAEDYTLIWPGVVRAVNEFASQRALAVHFTRRSGGS